MRFFLQGIFFPSVEKLLASKSHRNLHFRRDALPLLKVSDYIFTPILIGGRRVVSTGSQQVGTSLGITRSSGLHRYSRIFLTNYSMRSRDFFPYPSRAKSGFIPDEHTLYFTEALKPLLQAKGISTIFTTRADDNRASPVAHPRRRPYF